jgi:hypothetical protein
MIGEQWKAVCCRKETVRGTELDIVQFGSFDSATYTAVIRDVRAVAEGVYCFRHIYLTASISAVHSGRIDGNLN